MCLLPPLPCQAEATALLLRASVWGRSCSSLGPFAPFLGLEGWPAEVSGLKIGAVLQQSG